MKTTVTLLVAAVVGALGIGFADGRRAPSRKRAEPVAVNADKSKISKFMRAKLKASESVLDGLVTEDYDKIRTGAEKMIVMSKASDWQVIQGPTYAQYSAEFRRAAERLVKRGKARQLDSAALAYMHVTMTCINCHKYVKNAKVAQGEPLSPRFKAVLLQDRVRALGRTSEIRTSKFEGNSKPQ